MAEDKRLLARSIAHQKVEVHDVGDSRVWDITFSCDDVLGSRFSLASRVDDSTLYGFVSWVNEHFVMIVQDPDSDEHRTESVVGAWPFEDFDLSPLDDPANSEVLAELLVTAICLQDEEDRG